MSNFQRPGWGNYSVNDKKYSLEEAKSIFDVSDIPEGNPHHLWERRYADIIEQGIAVGQNRQALAKIMAIIITRDDDLAERFPEIASLVRQNKPYKVQFNMVTSKSAEDVSALMVKLAKTFADDEQFKEVVRTTTNVFYRGKAIDIKSDPRYVSAQSAWDVRKRVEKREGRGEEAVEEPERPVDEEKVARALYFTKMERPFMKMSVEDEYGEYQTIEQLAEEYPQIVDAFTKSENIFDLLANLQDIMETGEGFVSELADQVYNNLKKPLIRGAETAIDNANNTSHATSEHIKQLLGQYFKQKDAVKKEERGTLSPMERRALDEERRKAEAQGLEADIADVGSTTSFKKALDQWWKKRGLEEPKTKHFRYGKSTEEPKETEIEPSEAEEPAEETDYTEEEFPTKKIQPDNPEAISSDEEDELEEPSERPVKKQVSQMSDEEINDLFEGVNRKSPSQLNRLLQEQHQRSRQHRFKIEERYL